MNFLKTKILIGALSISFIVLLVVFFYLKNKDYREVLDKLEYSNVTPLEKPLNHKMLTEALIYKNEILEEATKYKITPNAILGIIIAEASMHSEASNYFEKYYIQSNLLNKEVDYLEELAIATKKKIDNKKLLGESLQEFEFRMKTGLIWTIGICQISIIKAIDIEKPLSQLESRPTRNTKEIIISLLIPEENIKYCAFELGRIRDIYLENTGIDISKNAEILTSVYNIGEPEKLVTKYEENKNLKPKSNIFGMYVKKHLSTIETNLTICETPPPSH